MNDPAELFARFSRELPNFVLIPTNSPRESISPSLWFSCSAITSLFSSIFLLRALLWHRQHLRQRGLFRQARGEEYRWLPLLLPQSCTLWKGRQSGPQRPLLPAPYSVGIVADVTEEPLSALLCLLKFGRYLIYMGFQLFATGTFTLGLAQLIIFSREVRQFSTPLNEREPRFSAWAFS